MKIVLALGMSSPLSTIVVASRMSYSLRDESQHHLFQLVLGHLAVADADPRLGHDLAAAAGATASNVVDAVVDEVNLPAAVQFAHDRVADQLVARTA